MPRKTKQQKYENYDMRKQCFVLNKYSTDMSELGTLLDNKGGEVSDKATMTALNADEKYDKILELDFTKNVIEEDQSELIQEINKSYKRMEKSIQKYNGPFKEILEASNYIGNPANGDILDAYVDQPSLERIMSSFATAPSFVDYRYEEKEIDDPINKGKKIKKTVSEKYIDLENMNKRKAALGEFAGYLTDYYGAVKNLFQVVYERQKAEKDDKKGLDISYMKKYAKAIDDFTTKFDKLKTESEKRYERTDLSQGEKDFLSIRVKNPRAGKLDKNNKMEPDFIDRPNLNNPLGNITSTDPKVDNRDAIPVAVANMKGQSQAIKNGWTLADFKLLGYISEAKADVENSKKSAVINVENAKITLDKINKEIEAYKNANNEAMVQDRLGAKKLQQETLENYEQMLKDSDAAYKDINAIYDKYYNVKNPDYITRREALKEAEEYNNKYKDTGVASVCRRTFAAIEDEVKDPYELEGKTRLEQAESMLKSLKDVDQILRSSDNFRDVKNGVEKLVEMARKHPNMNEEQFWEYQKQVLKVKGYVNKYLKGKNKELVDYAKKNNGKQLKRSEYTSKRINAVSDLWEKLDCHMSLTSGEFTKEYTGNEKERALAKYERLVKMEGEHRQRILGKERTSEDYLQYDHYNITNEYESFLKSLYLEKMKHRFDTDPTFTATQFYKSLNSKEIADGVKKMKKELSPKFKTRIKQSIKERIHLDGEDEDYYVVEDRYFRGMVAFDSPILANIPIGVGQDYVRFEYKMELMRTGLADESVFDNDDYVDGPKYEPDEWEIEKYNIVRPEPKKEEPKKEEKKVDKNAVLDDAKKQADKKNEDVKEENKNEIKEDKKEPKKEDKKVEKKAEPKPNPNKINEEKKAPVKQEKKQEKKSEKKPEKKQEQDSLAAQVVEALTSDGLYQVSRDPLYRSIVSDFSVHAGNEKPGENTRISDETLAKMAKYVDKISDITNLNQDDYTRRHLVESAFRQYTQKPEEFKKNSSIFKVEFPMGKNPNPVNFCYRDFFHAQHADKVKRTVAAYSKAPNDKNLETSVMNEAYKILMVNVVDMTVGMEKGGKISKYNNALDSTDSSYQREDFVNNQLSKDFKEKFREEVLSQAKTGELNSMEACENALAKMLNENKKKKDVLGERSTRALIDKLKIKPNWVNKKAEMMNNKQQANMVK